MDHTDLVLPGRLPLVLSRSYNPLDPFGQIAGVELPLGPHWALSVDVVLLELGPSLRRLILPGNAHDHPRSRRSPPHHHRPLGSRTTFEYDAQRNLVALTDPEQSVIAIS